MKVYCVKQFYEDGRLPRIIVDGVMYDSLEDYRKVQSIKSGEEG